MRILAGVRFPRGSGRPLMAPGYCERPGRGRKRQAAVAPPWVGSCESQRVLYRSHDSVRQSGRNPTLNDGPTRVPDSTSSQEIIARRVRELRTSQRMTQLQLAERAGVARSQVASIERAQKAPTIRTLEAFASALGVTVDELVRTEGKGPRTRDAADAVAARLRAFDPRVVDLLRELLELVEPLEPRNVQRRGRV